jgi:hypothetical protein
MKNKEILGLCGKEFNSNNGWGFGGARGFRYQFSELVSLTIGAASTRHMGEFPFTKVEIGYLRPLDLSGYGKAQLKKAQEIVVAALILEAILK